MEMKCLRIFPFCLELKQSKHSNSRIQQRKIFQLNHHLHCAAKKFTSKIIRNRVISSINSFLSYSALRSFFFSPSAFSLLAWLDLLLRRRVEFSFSRSLLCVLCVVCLSPFTTRFYFSFFPLTFLPSSTSSFCAPPTSRAARSHPQSTTKTTKIKSKRKGKESKKKCENEEFSCYFSIYKSSRVVKGEKLSRSRL